MSPRKLHTPVTPQFVELCEGITPPLGDDLRVYPGLPIMYMAQDYGRIHGMDTGIVIQAGEPVGVATIGGKKWLVPASSKAYTLTYGVQDVGATENIDSAGDYVTTTGASTATIPASLPIGIAHQAIRQNGRMTTGAWMNGENFQNEYKEVVVRRRTILIPYTRRGSNAIGKVNEGDLIGVGSIGGDTLSATSRPKLAPVRMSAGSVTGATAGSIALTPTQASVATGNKFTVTVDGLTVTFEVAATAATVAYNHIKFVKGASTLKQTIDNFVAAFNGSAIGERATAANTEDTSITITAKNYGTAPAIAYAEVSDTGDGWAGVVTDGTDAVGAVHADETVDNLNLGIVIGRCIRAYDAGLPANYDLSFAITPRGSGLSGSDTGGVPQELYSVGNTFAGATTPANINEAGALVIALEL